MHHPPNQQLPALKDVLNDLPTRLALMSKLPFFKGVEPEICKRIADSSKPLHRARRELIVKQNDPSGVAYLILRGLIEISHEAKDGSEYYLPYRGPGKPGGHTKLVCVGIHDYTVTAVKDCDLLLLDPTVFKECFEASPALVRSTVYYLMEQFGETARRLHRIASFKTHQARVVMELVEIADALAEKIVMHPDDKGGVIVIDWLKRDRFAEKIGANRNVVATARQTLQRHGLITAHPVSGIITLDVANVEKLRSLLNCLVESGLEDAIAYRISHKWRLD